jgi:DNA mismatch repair protein MutS
MYIENCLVPKDFTHYTPVMKQYLEARQGLPPNTILLFRMGDFYEAFFNDAILIAKELEITLTGKAESNYPDGKIPMAGVPAKAVKNYIAKLLNKGYRICVAEQMADPKTCKGLVPREICMTYTPGTVSELDLIAGFNNNFIASVIEESEVTGLAYADVSTGEFYISQFDKNLLRSELNRIKAAEIIVPGTANKATDDFVAELSSEVELKGFDYHVIPKRSFSAELALANITREFRLKSLDKNLSEYFKLALKAAGALLDYIKDTQPSLFSDPNQQLFSRLKTYQLGEFMIFDEATRKNLEINESSTGDKNLSLFKAVDRTRSQMSKRRLHSWLNKPICDLETILTRQSAITELRADTLRLDKLASLLAQVADLERLVHRLQLVSIKPRELASLKDSLQIVSELPHSLNGLKTENPFLDCLKTLPDCLEFVVQAVQSALKDELPLTISEGRLIRSGYNQVLDDYICLVEDSESWLKNYENSLREEFKIKNIKVAFNKVHGYFIETSRLNQNLLPEARFTCKQTMVNTVRFVSEELKDFEAKIISAESKRNGLEEKLFKELRFMLAQHAAELKDLADQIASFGALVGLAQLSLEQNYICPEVNHSLDIEIEAGRHPVLEQKLDLGSFTPNDLELNQEKVMLLTGPNMAGKSTFMRQNALIILLAQIGSYVPATKAKIGLVDRIFTRIGAADDLSSGQSTFMVEMNEVASILNGYSERSFLIIDEVGRGTSTYDGVSIAWSLLEYLAQTHPARTIFSTHYHELAILEDIQPQIANFQMLVAEPKAGLKDIIFLHKVARGSAEKSYGIEVARLAGLPAAVLTRAFAVNKELQKINSQRLTKSNREQLVDSMQLSLFS